MKIDNDLYICNGNDVTIEMIEQAVEIDKEVYQKKFWVSPKKCISKWKKNKNIYTMLIHKPSGQVAGYFCVIPITYVSAYCLITGKHSEKNIPIREMAKKADIKNGHYALYVSSFVISKKYRNTKSILMLLKALKNVLCKNYVHLVALSATKEGKRLLEMSHITFERYINKYGTFYTTIPLHFFDCDEEDTDSEWEAC